MAVKSTSWSKTSVNSTGYTSSSVNSTAYTATTVNSSNWENEIFSSSYLLYEDGSTGLLLENGTDLLGLQTT